MRTLIPLLLLCFVYSTFMAQSDVETILFSSNRSGNSDIYVMLSDGSDLKQLTISEDEEWGPIWIESTRISFLRQNEDGITRHELDIVSQEERFLSHPPNCILDDKNALKHPTSQEWLYSCEGNIFVWDPATGQLDNLTNDVDGQSSYPAWCDEGQGVLFTNNQGGHNDIYKLDLTTMNTNRLTNSPFNNERGDLSPNGQWLVYSSDQFDKGNQDVLLKNLVTGEIKRLTDTKGTELIARWSTKDNVIYYGGNDDGNWEIYKYDLTNNITVRLTFDENFDGDPRVR